MEVRVKTGENLTCEYTGKQVPALIKIYSHDEKIESAWIGSEALTDALRILHSVAAVKAPAPTVAAPAPMPNVVPTVFNSIPIPGLPPEIAAPNLMGVANLEGGPFREPDVKIPGRNPKDPIEMVQQFEAALLDLVANPPKTRDNEPDGQVPETAVREIVRRFKASFKNPNAMFNPLRKHLSMSRERFDTIMEGNR